MLAYLYAQYLEFKGILAVGNIKGSKVPQLGLSFSLKLTGNVDTPIFCSQCQFAIPQTWISVSFVISLEDRLGVQMAVGMLLSVLETKRGH